MKKSILISFIIPAHNEEKVIGECLKSILLQIKSLKEKCEIIVVNDGSNDKTADIVKHFSDKRIKLLNFEKGHSAAFSRNKGSEVAKGEYFVFLDADQLIEENFLHELANFLKKEQEVLSFFVLPRNPKTLIQKAWAGFRNAHYCRAFVFRKDVFLKLKFDERLFYIEDNELWERFSKAGYKLVDTGLKVYHIDPETFEDFIRQRKWHGKGILCWIKIKKKYSPLRYFIPCILPIFFIFKSPIIKFFPIVFYFIFFWSYYALKSKQPYNSLLWVLMDYFGRFVSLYYFFKEILIGNKVISPK